MSAHIKKKALAKKKKVLARKRRAPRRKHDLREIDELLSTARVIPEPTGVDKMSEVLQDFVKPYVQLSETESNLRRLFDLGMMAWNASLLSLAQRKKTLQDTVKAFPPEARDDLRGVLETLIQRKLEHFADNRRQIIDFDLSMEAAGPCLKVMSTAPEEMSVGQ
jgi:hypothetical protein